MNEVTIKAVVMLLIISNIKQGYATDCNYEYFQLLMCSELFTYICRYDLSVKNVSQKIQMLLLSLTLVQGLLAYCHLVYFEIHRLMNKSLNYLIQYYLGFHHFLNQQIYLQKFIITAKFELKYHKNSMAVNFHLILHHLN